MARGDFWAAREVPDPEVEWSWSSSMSGLTGVGIYHGIEGVEAATRDVFKAWEMVRQEAEEFIGKAMSCGSGPHARTTEGKHPGARGHGRSRMDLPRRPGDSVQGLRHPDRSPRSRRAIGVGDAALPGPRFEPGAWRSWYGRVAAARPLRARR